MEQLLQSDCYRKKSVGCKMNKLLECVRWRLIARERDVAVRLVIKHTAGEVESLVQLTFGQKNSE